MHVGHTSAAIDVDYCPTGTEFVTGSYDKSVRIFESGKVKTIKILTFFAINFDSNFCILFLESTQAILFKFNFNWFQISSREVYHTKRMQRLTCVAYTLDSRYIVSGSDEMNLRLWKAIAWQKQGVVIKN